MSFIKTKKYLKKALITFICLWLVTTTIPINVVFAEEKIEETPIEEVEENEENSVFEEQEIEEEIIIDEEESASLEEDNEEQKNNEEIEEENQEQEDLEDNESLLTSLGDGEESTTVNIIDLYKDGQKVDVKTINFAEAVEAVNSDIADKIVLLKSFNAKENYEFDNSVELDLNGKKIVFNSNKKITFNGDQSFIKNGTIVVSSFESNATTAVIAVGDNAELQVDGDATIKSRVAFKLNNSASVYVKEAEICARNLIDTSYENVNFHIEDEAKMNLVSDLNELTGYGYWRTSNSGLNGEISITGGLFTNNKYPIYESNTTTADLSEYYGLEYSDIFVSEDPYKYQVVHGGGVVFDTKGGTWASDFTVPNYYDYDEGLTLPTASNIARAGYTFDGWKNGEEGSIIESIEPYQTGSISLFASWTARNDITYTVKHHYESLTEPDVFPDDAEHLVPETFNNGVVDEFVQPNLLPKDGYATPNKKAKQIAGDGSTVIDYYYRVGLNELVVSSEDENKGTVSIKNYPSTSAAIATGEEVTIEANPLPGYKFNRWVNNNSSETSDEISHEIIMGSESLSYTAYFEIDTDSEVWVVKVLSSQETKASNVCYSEGDYLYYQTIEDAVEYAVNGATVIMDGDLEVNESIPIEKEITLNLNNHTISQAEVAKADYYTMSKHMIMVLSSGKLILTGGGEILNDDTDDEYWLVNGSALYNNGGTLILDDGVNVTTTGRHYPAIINNAGSLIVNEATITSNSIAIDFIGGDAEINDGAVVKNTNLLKEMEQYYNDDDRRNTLLYGEYSTTTSRVNIKGGTFTAKTESIFGSDYTYNYYVTVNGGTFNPSKDGYVMSTSGFCLEFYGGTVNSENYVFGDWCGVIYDGYFNIKNGIVPKNNITCVYGGKFHVYDNNPSKINGLMYNYSAIKNLDSSDKDNYEYIVLGKSSIYFDSMGGSEVKSIEGYRNRAVENMPANPTMTGYTFDGWYTERGLVNEFDPTVSLTKEYYYLYAKWKLNPNDSIWGARLITERDSIDEYRKYEENGIIYYYYWYDENDPNEDGWDFSRSFDDASDGETIELLKDINLDNHHYYYTSIDQIDATNLTLDLNNHTLKFKNNYSIFNFNNSLCKKFTIQDGTIIQETDYEYSQSFFESMTGTEVISKNVNYVSNYHTTDEYSRLLLAGMNIKMEIQGGFVSDTITLVDSFTEDNTITIDKDYDFRYAGDAFCHIADSLSIGQAILQDGLYVYDPDLFTDDGYVSIEFPENEKVTRKENTYAYDEVIQQTTYREADVTYNYKIVPGYEVIFDFNKKDKINTTVKANVATTEGVGKLTSDQIPTTSPKDGFTFDGWYTERAGGTKITDLTQETIDDDVTYYAHWNTETFDVEFNLNGGNVDGEIELDPISVSYKDKYPTLPTPTKTGYNFAGWYTVSQNEVEDNIYPPLIEKDSEVLTAGDHTLYAHWTVKTITVKLDYNGGTYSLYSLDNVDGITMQIDYDSTFDLPEVYRDGYEFAGWYTERTGGTRVDDEDGGKLYSEFPFTTLYAHWTAEERNIVLSGYYRYDSSHVLAESQDERIVVTCGEVFGNLLTNPSIDNEAVTFIGWNTDVTGRGKYITNTDIFEIKDFYLGGGIDSDLYLYAIYDDNRTREYESKTIYFDYGYNNSNVNLPSYYVYNYTEQSPEHISDFYGCDGADYTQGELPVPTRLGYTFNGWKIDNTSITKNSLLSEVFNDSNIKTAVAQWAETTNGINAYFYANGGVFNPGGEVKETEKTVTQTIGSNYSLPSVNPTKAGYTFAGWVLASGSRQTENYAIYAYGDIITNTTSVKEEDCQFVNVNYPPDNADSILLVAVWLPSTITYKVRHLYKNPYYDEYSIDRYYKEQYYFVNEEEYTVDTGTHVLIKPKEYDGVVCNGSNFNEIYEYQGKFDGYVLINEDYDEDEPFELYYDSNYFELTIDYNRDGNFEVEEEGQRSFSDDIMVVNKYYRDVFDDSTSRSNYENGSDSGTALALRNAKTDDFNRGYTFAKWVDDDGNEIKFYDSTKTYTGQNKPTTMPAEPLTIHAVWTPITYNIEFSKGTYSDQIQQAKMANQVVTYGTANDKLNKNIYTREGYDFIGWSREEQLDPDMYEDYDHFNVDVVDCGLIDDNDFANDFTFEAGATVTIYPVWRAKEYTVTFHLDGAVFNDYPYYEIKDDCIIDHAHYSFTWTPLPPDAGWSLTKKGYDFIGWYVDEDGDYPTDGTEEEINKWYENHSSAFIDKEDHNYHYYTYTKNIDVYLRWDPCTYLFDFGLLFGKEEGTFDVNSGETYRETFSGDQQFLGVLQTFNTNVKLPDFEIFTEEGERTPRTGYDFVGWCIGYTDDNNKYVQEFITEDTVINEEFYDKFYELMHQEYNENYRTLNIDSEWKERNDVKYKINIYLQVQDGLSYYYPEGINPSSIPERPTATYEFTGRARSEIDIYDALDHKKYKYDGFRLETGQEFEYNPAIWQTYSDNYHNIEAYGLQIRKGMVCPDGSTEFNVFYYRNDYPVYIYESRKDAVKTTDEYGNSFWDYPAYYDEFQYGETVNWANVADEMRRWRGLSEEFNAFSVIYPASVQELPNKMPSTELVLVPTFAGDEFKITFNANGGSFLAGDTKELTQYYDTLFNVPSEIPTLEGFAFDGWYLKDGTKIERTEGYYVPFRGDRIAYAHWSSPLFEVSIEDYSNDITNGLSIYSNIGDVENRINREYEKTVTIRLLSDAAIHDSASFMASSITFDLNGHTLFCDAANYSDFITFVESDVTITDTSSTKLGKIVSNGHSTISLDNSSFKINAGTIENQSTYGSSTVLYVNNEPGIDVNILGGSLIYNNEDTEDTEDTVDYNPSCIYNANSSTINIGNGTKKDSNIFLTLPEYGEGSIIHNLSNVTINGGIFSAPSGNLGNFNEGDEVSVVSGFFELRDPIEGSEEESSSIINKLIFTGGYFNIENIDAMDHYIDKENKKVMINSFGGYYGNNAYLYFYEISDKVKTTVHFVVTDPVTHEDDNRYGMVTMDNVFTGDKIKNLDGVPEVPNTDEYYFEGWTSSRDGNYNVTIISNGYEHTLYSLWTKRNHALKFTIADESKGIKDPDDIEVTELRSTTIDVRGDYPALPSKEAVESIGRSNPKYVFGGWYTSTNKAVKEGDQYKSNGILDGDEIVLHAKWIEADIYIVKMNSISKNNLAVKSLANLVCETEVVYENTDDNIIRIENENIKNYKFSYWEINGAEVIYDSENNKWEYLEKEVAVEGEEARERAEEEHRVGLNFTEFIEGDGKVVNVNAVYEYIGVQGPLLTVEGYKGDYSVEVTYEEKEPEVPGNGDPVEPETIKFTPEFDESTGLYVVKENIKPGSKVKIVYDNESKDFSAWTNFSNVVITSKPTLDTVVSVDATYKLVTKEDEGELTADSYYIEFRNYSGLLVKSAVIKDEVQLKKLTENHSLVPTLIGWKFNYWSIDYTNPVSFDAIKKTAGESHKTVILRPIYKINTDQKVTVSINYLANGSSFETHTFDEQVGGSRYITAPKEKEGHKFSCWKDSDNNILGYTNTYAISIINYSESPHYYYACYDEDVTSKEAIIVVNDIGPVTEIEEYKTKDKETGEEKTENREINKIVFSVTRSIPDDCELLEHGIIYSTSSSLSGLEGDELMDKLKLVQNADTKAWELQSGIKKYVGASKDKVNVLTVKFDRSGKEENPIYLMGYIIIKYKDKDDIDIIYTDCRKNTFRDFVPKEEGGNE